MRSGALLTPLKRIPGPVGDVRHALKVSAPGYAGFGEAYFSEIHEAAVKSWRRHRLTTTNVVVAVGAVLFVLHDPDAGAFQEYRLSGDESYFRLTIAPGVWFAFKGLGPGTSLLLSIIDREHDPAESETTSLDAFPYSWGQG